MPLIKGNARIMQDGTKMIQYTDTVGPSYVTYTLENEQESLIIMNKGLKPIVFSVGTTTDVTLNPGIRRVVETNFTSFMAKSTEGIQQFEVLMDEVGTTLATSEAINTLTSQLAQKVSQVNGKTPDANGNVTIDVPEVDTTNLATKTELNTVASGSPNGVYATLTDLQNAFPTGDSRSKLVTADGNWYYWSGSAWTVGGVYQGTGIADGSITFEKMSPSNMLEDLTEIIKHKITGKAGSTYPDQLWSSFWFDTNETTFTEGVQVNVSYKFYTQDSNIDGNSLKFYQGVAPFGTAHGNWWGSATKLATLEKNEIYIVTHTFTVTAAQVTNSQTSGYKYRVCVIPVITDNTLVTSYFAWDFKLTVGSVDFTNIVHVDGVSGGTNMTEFKPEKISGFEPKKIMTTTYTDYATARWANLEKSFERVKSGLYEKEVRCFGDSITAGTKGGFLQYISSALNAKIVNHGSSGAATGRLVGIMTPIKDRDAHSPAETPDYTNTSAVTIMIGTNLGVNGALSDIPSTNKQTVDLLPFEYNGVQITTEEEYFNLFPNTYYGNLGICIEYVKFKNPKTKIYLITPPRNLWSNDSWMPAVREALLEIGKFYCIPVIDAQINAGVDKKHFHKFTYDDLHLNELGNELWGKYVADQMRYL